MVTIQYTAYETIATAVNGVSIATGAQAFGAAIDNSTTRYLWDDLELQVTFGTNPTANTAFEVYLIAAVDGTNYADGDGTILPPSTALVAVFPVRAVTTAQRIAARGIPIPPGLYKYVVRNAATGQTGNPTTLRYRSYGTESV